MANCLLLRPMRQSRNLHLNNSMRSTIPPARFAFLLCLAAILPGAASTRAQSDRPPWARKSSASSSASTTTTTSAPSSPTSSTPPSPVNPLDNPSDPPAQQQRGRIRVNVQLVSVLASVLDEHNRPAPDLPREAFQIFEEGVEQKLAVFESETQQPLDLALMIDASLSAHKEIAFEQEAAAHFIRQVLRPGDRLAVYSVGEDVTQLAN